MPDAALIAPVGRFRPARDKGTTQLLSLGTVLTNLHNSILGILNA